MMGEMSMNSKKKLWGAAGLALVLVCVMGLVYFFSRPKPLADRKQVSLTVRDNTGSETVYEVKTSASHLIEVMDDLKASADFDYEGNKGDYGFFITSVNGIAADYETDQAYWAIYVNGEYGSYAADAQPVNDGDLFVLAYEQ